MKTLIHSNEVSKLNSTWVFNILGNAGSVSCERMEQGHPAITLLSPAAVLVGLHSPDYLSFINFPSASSFFLRKITFSIWTKVKKEKKQKKPEVHLKSASLHTVTSKTILPMSFVKQYSYVITKSY